MMRMMAGASAAMQGQQKSQMGGGMGMGNMMMRAGGGMSAADMAGRMGGGMGGLIGKQSQEELKKNLKTLTRTDFLLQFVWQPPKPEELPKDDEERAARIKELSDKMTEAQKNNPAVVIPKAEEIEAVSREKSKQVDSALSNALGAGGQPGAPAAQGAPVGGAPAGAVPPPGRRPSRAHGRE